MNCTCENVERRKLTTSNGGFQVKTQCLICGQTSQALKKEPNDEKLTEIDRSIREAYVMKNADIWRRDRDLESEAIRQKMQWEYAEYLKSDEWKAMRDRVMQRDNYLCQCCLNASAYAVHHKTYDYKKLGVEAAFWLIAVCDPCHKKLHEMIK